MEKITLEYCRKGWEKVNDYTLHKKIANIDFYLQYASGLLWRLTFPFVEKESYSRCKGFAMGTMIDVKNDLFRIFDRLADELPDNFSPIMDKSDFKSLESCEHIMYEENREFVAEYINSICYHIKEISDSDKKNNYTYLFYMFKVLFHYLNRLTFANSCNK